MTNTEYILAYIKDANSEEYIKDTDRKERLNDAQTVINTGQDICPWDTGIPVKAERRK